jgi:uncharacterized membrane protein YeaQ/YmgE (transglycosylase-associated protein family)
VDLLLWLIIGGVVGGFASFLVRYDDGQAIWMNVAIGAISAMAAGWLVSPLLGTPTVNRGAFSGGALLVPTVGAVIVLLIFNIVRRGRRR